MSKPKFTYGDPVRIVKYGHPIWENKLSQEPLLNLPVIYEDERTRIVDLQPDKVGKEGVISAISQTQGNYSYGIASEEGESAWYNEDQLELIKKS